MYNDALNANAAIVSNSTQAKELVTNQSTEREINIQFSEHLPNQKQFKVRFSTCRKDTANLRSPTHTDYVATLNFIQVSPTHFCS